MLDRDLAIPLHRAAQLGEPVLVHGPRSAGKTTLLRREFPGHRYVSLEDAADRAAARQTPQRFLAKLRGPAVIDDLHRAPELTDHLVASNHSGPLLLASSRRLQLPRETLELHPPTRAERERRKPLPLETLGRFQPPPPTAVPEPPPWPDGRRRFLESDVRDLIRVHDLDRFETFLAVAESRSGAVLDQQALAAESGLSHRTVTRWLAVLETCFLTLRLPASQHDFGRRLMRSPKLHFPTGGFESRVVSEIYRNARHAHQTPHLSYWRDSNGFEIPLIVEFGLAPAMPVGIAAAPTPADYSRLQRWMDLAGVRQAAMIAEHPARSRRGAILNYVCRHL